MATNRTPGPVCVTKLQCDIDPGTQARTATACPGVEGLMAPRAPAPVLWCSVDDDFSHLFQVNKSVMPGPELTDADYQRAASQLGVEVALLRAFAEVESSAQGAFDDAGRPTILFERHIFHEYSGGVFSKDNPGISNATSGGYGKYSAQYARLGAAYDLDQTAALMATSWGKFQILGASYSLAGYHSLHAFVRAMISSQVEQLNALVQFCLNKSGLQAAMQAKDWAGIARRYNGAGYAKNAYDVKLRDAYLRYSR